MSMRIKQKFKPNFGEKDFSLFFMLLFQVQEIKVNFLIFSLN